MVKITFFWAGIFLNNISFSGRRQAIAETGPRPTGYNFGLAGSRLQQQATVALDDFGSQFQAACRAAPPAPARSTGSPGQPAPGGYRRLPAACCGSPAACGAAIVRHGTHRHPV